MRAKAPSTGSDRCNGMHQVTDLCFQGYSSLTSTCDSNTWHGEEQKISAGNLSLNWRNLSLQCQFNLAYLSVLSMIGII